MTKTLILVIGCPRSGTSAVAGSLAAAGVHFGDDLIPPAYDNSLGFFESLEVVSIHNRLMWDDGADWTRPPSGPIDYSGMMDRVRAVVRGLPGPVCGVKDPRASFFIDLWMNACEAEDVRFCVLEVTRDYRDVAASLAKREGWSSKRALQLVSDYECAVEKYEYPLGGPDVKYPERWSQVRYPYELQRPKKWARRFDEMEIPLLEPSAPCDFFDPSLVHHGAPMKWTVLIPSCSDKKVLACVKDLMEAHPTIRADQIVVISDHLLWETRQTLRSVRWIDRKKPFVFAEAINAGAKASDPESDVVILGDDVRFETPGALDKLARASNGAAIIAPEVIGICGQPAQRKGSQLETADWVAFICAYIPRRMWSIVGPLDERFVGYGYDDVDWCRRAQAHGEIRITHDVTVRHLDESSYRSNPKWVGQYQENRTRYQAKWASL